MSAVRRYLHRVNDPDVLARTPASQAIELDLRCDRDGIIITHDPGTAGVRAEDYFPRIGRRPCILNVKCDGIAGRVIELAERHGMTDFFVHECSLATTVQLARSGEKRLSIRYSEFEAPESILRWRGLVDWVWVDCFSRYPADDDAWPAIAAAFRICVGSPELYGHATDVVAAERRAMTARTFHAVCTKDLDAWPP